MEASKILNFSKRHRPFFLYMTIGMTGALLDFCTLLFLVNLLQVNEYIANPISMSVGITNNFFLNAYFNFKKTDKLFKRYLSFYAVGIIGILISNLFLWVFNDLLGGNIQSVLDAVVPFVSAYRLEIVKAVSIVVIAVIQYVLNKRFSFQHQDTAR